MQNRWSRGRGVIGVLIAVSLSLLFVAEATASVPKDGWGFAIADDSDASAQPGALGERFARLRPKTFRFQMHWNASPGDRENYHFLIARARAQGVQQVVAAFKKNGSAPDADDYGDSVAGLIDEFKTEVDIWGVLNEPNLGDGWLPGIAGAQKLAAYYKEVESAVNTYDNGAFLMSPDFADRSDLTSIATYLNAYVNAKGGFGDVIGFHAYWAAHARNTAPVTSFVSTVRSFPGAANLPIWITEVGGFGLNVDSGLTTYNPFTQALSVDWIVDTLANVPGIDRIYHYHMRAGNPKWDTALLDANGTPRHGWSRWCAASHGGNTKHPDCVEAPPSSPPPTAITGSASDVQETSATLVGTVNPNGVATSYTFEFGKSTAYGESAPVPAGYAGSGTAPVALSVPLSGLEPGVTYHYRIKATSAGGTSYGDNQQFTTRQPKPAVVLDASGRQHVYYRAPNGQLKEWYWTGSAWSTTSWGYPNYVRSNPSAISTSDGGRWVYYRGPGGELRGWSFKGSSWSETGWGYNNAVAGDPTAVATSDGSRWVYYRNPAGQLHGWWFNGANWNENGWGYENAVASDPSAVAMPDGSRWVYYRNSAGQLRSWWLQGANWSENGWGYENAVAGDPSAVTTSDESRWVYYRNPARQLHGWWFNGANWNENGWGYENAVAGDPSAVAMPDGSRWVYFRNPAGQLHSWWLQGSNWSESGWGYENAMAGDPTAIVNNAGVREVYYLDQQGRLNRWSFHGANWSFEMIG